MAELVIEGVVELAYRGEPLSRGRADRQAFSAPGSGLSPSHSWFLPVGPTMNEPPHKSLTRGSHGNRARRARPCQVATFTDGNPHGSRVSNREIGPILGDNARARIATTGLVAWATRADCPVFFGARGLLPARVQRERRPALSALFCDRFVSPCSVQAERRRGRVEPSCVEQESDLLEDPRTITTTVLRHRRDHGTALCPASSDPPVRVLITPLV